MNKFDLLSKALEIVENRGEDYGDVLDNHNRIAAIWSVILGVTVKSEQVALCMAGMKIARLCNTPDHQDSWIDLAGYAAVGSECLKIAAERADVSNQETQPPAPHQQSNEQTRWGQMHEGQ